MEERLQGASPVRRAACGQAEGQAVRRAKLVERDGRIAVVTGVPMEECPACGDRLLAEDVAVRLDAAMRRLLESGAETATANWDDVASPAA